ncbi:hypothetical protein BP5796_03862 [Coleophoma crateriformis]|uniref:FAD-binding FR-type domain-containing protein n=1 Tax=Coleophoma crateriformis TaxID=565419 RepID=A0A3D8SGQ8_9HELO|nr:hypothetical protein BP5796_03862 [Coleophoma crateriformis]
MAQFYQAATQWHEGEVDLHRRLRVPLNDNPTVAQLSPFGANVLLRSPLLALGTLDAEGRPWTTVWGGEPGFSRAIAQSIIGVKTTVDRGYDPVVETLLGTKGDGEVIKEEGRGRMVSALAIDLESRNRVKLYGRMVAGALQATEEGIGEVQLVVKIEQSLGNCPKYLNKRHIIPHLPQPKLQSTELPLSQIALDLIARADLFFISSSNHDADMDTNHRGGPPGFVRVLSNEKDGVTLVYPEYSGNRLYQTLGNLSVCPQAGLVFPDFETGDMLYLTGKTEILAGRDASNLIAHTNLAVKFRVESVRYVANSLAVRGEPGEFSPYNPQVRYLSTETRNDIAKTEVEVRAKLLSRKLLSPTVARFRFRIENPNTTSTWKPGQYVALGFEDELDIGYSHMRDDDPKSLNDDYLRTFTVSNIQAVAECSDEFEITIRKVGVVTHFLFKYNLRSELSVPLKGFGGEFFIEQGPHDKVGFIAAGVGITPLLPQLAGLDLERLSLHWTIKSDDIGLAIDVIGKDTQLAKQTTLFITQKESGDAEDLKVLKKLGVSIQYRRMQSGDLHTENVDKWYLCVSPAFRSILMSWLNGQKVYYEDFNY